MKLSELIGVSSGALLIILTIIQISPIKLNPWSWLAKKIGKAINSDVLKEIEDIKHEQDLFDEKFEKHIEDELERDANFHRKRILRFNVGLMKGETYTHEYFTDMLLDIDEYEKYCNEHPLYRNNRAIIAVDNIKRTYEECLKSGTFLDDHLKH